MRIAYHSDSFARKKRFGLSRYSHALYRQLRQAGVQVIPFSTQSDFRDDQPDWLIDSGFRRVDIPRKFLAPLWTATGHPLAERWLPEFDLLHSIDVDYRAPSRKPWVVTIHDLGPLVHPHFFSNAVPWLLRAYVRAFARHADRIVCVSQSTADEVASLAGVPLGDRLTIIAEGVDAAFFEPAPAQADHEVNALLGSDAPFFLFSGSMNPRKNLERTLRAFMRLAPEIPHRLVLVGDLGWDAGPLQARLAEARASGRVIMPGYVSDDVLRALLRRAAGYFYPSLYEGFGLPILEAMAAGCPVIAGDNSSMPEVAGDAAILVDATDERSIEQAIRTLALDPAHAEALGAAGRVRARRFSWERVGAETLDVYRALV